MLNYVFHFLLYFVPPVDVVRNEVSFQVDQSWHGVLIVAHLCPVRLKNKKAVHGVPLPVFQF